MLGRPVRNGLLALVTIGLLAMAAPASAAQQSDTVEIEPGSHGAVKIDFRDGPTQDVSYDIQVTDGPNIDVLVMNNANYQKYQDGDSFSYVQDWSDLDTGNTDTTFTLKEHGTWWIVLDHTGQPDGGTQPATVGADSVTAKYTMETKTNVKETASETADQLPAPGVLVAATVLGGVALAAGRRSA